MPETFFTSDTHFGHANVIKHSTRPFASIEDMDEALIVNWNAWVAPKDTVYHLGDFAWRDALKYRDRLNGNIALIVGNHEAAAEKIKHRFLWVKDVHMVKVGDTRIWCSHYSHEVWPKSHHGAWHLYGHSHNSLPARDYAQSLDVGVDATAARLAGFVQGAPFLGLPQDYRPMSYEEVAAVIATRTWKAIDHHGEDCGP